MNYVQGNYALLDALKIWGINTIYGVVGGGVFELIKALPYYSAKKKQKLKYFTLSEYAAGFAPIGSYLATGQISACLSVPGAAIKLMGSGMSDAKVQRIPALYLICLNYSSMLDKTPLQDVGPYGMNIREQLIAEFGNDAVYMNESAKLPECIDRISAILSAHRPAIFMFHPDHLSQPIELTCIPYLSQEYSPISQEVNQFVDFVEDSVVAGKRIYLYVCSEAGINQKLSKLINNLQKYIDLKIFCTVNGSNACVGLENFLGHVGIGGQKEVNQCWQNLGKQDVLITLGIEAGDYHFLDYKSNVSEIWTISNQYKSYGFINGSYQHRFTGEFHLLKSDIAYALTNIANELETRKIKKKDNITPLEKIQARVSFCSPNCVDILSFYQNIQRYWQPNSIGFDDVCTAFRDRQFVLNQPSSCIRFFTSQDTSAMGSIFGMLVGAKLSNPQMHCFGFSGDGCWRLFGGAIPEAANLGIILFMFNNKSYGIVQHYTKKYYKKMEQYTQLQAVDFIMAAKSSGWDAIKLAPDLSNFAEIMVKAYSTKKSLLIEVEIDENQHLGFNPRENRLKNPSKG